MKRTNIYLPQIHINVLKGISKRTGLSVSEHIRRAIDMYVGEMMRYLDAEENARATLLGKGGQEE